MWRSLRHLITLISVVAFLGGGPRAAGSADSKGRDDYRNRDYAYAVHLPPGTEYTMAGAPNPNHGFRIDVGPNAFVWVDASYTDASTLAEVAAGVREEWQPKCSVESAAEGTLDGAAATEMVFRCRAERAGETTSIRILASLKTPHGRGRIRYQLGVQCPKDGNLGDRSEKMFDVVRRGFRHLPGD